MPRVCTVCNHKEAETIDALLLMTHDPRRGIALRYGLAVSSVWRHLRDHLPSDAISQAEVMICDLKEAVEEAKARQVSGLPTEYSRVLRLYRQARTVLAQVRRAGVD